MSYMGRIYFDAQELLESTLEMLQECESMEDATTAFSNLAREQGWLTPTEVEARENIATP